MSSISTLAEEGVRSGLCDRCLGRLVAKVGTGLSNQQRGAVMRSIASGEAEGEDEETLLELLSNPPSEHPEEDNCSLCDGLFTMLDDFAGIVASALEEWDYETFLLGCRPDPEMVEAEEVLWSELAVEKQEPLKSEMNREIGKRVALAAGKDVHFSHPDIVAVLDILYHHVDMEVNPIFFYGRYRKLERGIPQTRWPCRSCKGMGCDRCSGTGKMYDTSVEELVCKPLMGMACGVEHHFHGMGREDIDARMLGNGRPFVAQINRPKVRKIDIRDAEKAINQSSKGRVEISGLRPSTKEEVREIKAATPAKSYLVGLEFEDDIMDAVETLKNMSMPLSLEQRTPTRVSHRRSDIVRDKTILDMSVEVVSENVLEASIKASSGTYIKEFCHGDGGKTKPSIAEIVGIPCRVLFLDVLDIHCLEE